MSLFFAQAVQADDATVPISMQVQLLATVAQYDRSFSDRAKGNVRILVLTRSNDPESGRVGSQIASALGKIPKINGIPQETSTVSFESGSKLSTLCRERKISVVFLTPGFKDDIPDIKRALSGVNVLSVSSVGAYVQQGIVLGFDVISGKPKLLVNLSQAKSQNVSLKAELLKMVKVYE